MIKFPDLPGYSSDYVKSVLDEIALEGLDGIALNDLWPRLLKRPHFCPQPIDEAAKIFLWDVVRRLRSVEFYQLPEPRPPLVIYDRFEHIDPDLGMVIEPAEVPVDIYPNCKVEDLKKGIIGSCSTYETREDMTGLIRTLDYKDVEERWGHKLVVVASQTARRNALLNQDVNPNLELTPLQYLIMERVGRSRYHGEITQGRDGLQLICEDAKSLFYLRKILHKHRLITKQVFHHKVGAQNLSGLLLHLPRFFVERKPKALDVMEKIATYLKTKPNHMEEHNVLRQTLSLGTTLKKIIQAHNFQKFVKSEHVLYRVMYPEATEVDWRYKGQNKERLVRVLYLVDPNMDIKDLWQKYETMYEDDDDDKYGILSSESHRLLDRTLLDQAYAVLEKVGPDGMSQVALGNALGMDKLLSRSILRNLTRLKKVTVFMKDEKKQRTARYTLKKFEKSSTMRNQVFEEKDKLMKLVDKKKSKNVKPSITDTNQLFEKSVEFENSTLSDDLVQGSDTSLAEGKSKSTLGTRKTTGGLQKSTKVSCTKKRKLSETNNLVSQVSPQTKKKKPATKTKKTNGNELNSPVENAEHTFNKVVSTGAIELKEVKPDMKLISKTLKSSNLLTNTDPGIETSTVSFRLLKRTNMILEAVRKQKVIFDTSKLQKMIYEEEVKEGYEARMDKKSLLRIIHKLALDKLVQHLEITLRANNREKILRFVCDPTVSHDHSVIQSAIDQAKMKLDILGKESMKRKQRQKNKSSKPGTKESAADESLQNTDDHKNEEDDFSLKYNGRVGRMYGFKPKYMRMQVLHKYMFYLVYGYEGTEELDQKQALVEIRHQITLSDDVQKEMSQIYTPSLDWQMFLPPLPLHMGYPEGWALMSDILLRLPLSIFVQVVNVSYEVPGMEEYLNHPIKKHFLVKNLPAPLKTACTYARKYIFAIHEQVVRLCFTGLLQLGPQRLKEKDQVFVYMNRRALLWDTISSPCGYFQIAKDKNYPVHKYHFQTADDVEQYWHDFWNYCVHTILGGRLSQSGQVVVVEGVQTKPVMLEAVEPRSVDEAPMRDVGYIPGDHLGAAGVDSAMFAHLKRNWYWNPLKTNFGSMINSQTAPSTELQLMVKLPECQNQEKKPLRVISETSSARRRGKRLKRQHGELKEGQRIAKRKLKVKRTVRTLKNRVLSRRKPYYDQTDREALLKMSKLRVDWTSKEDNLLLLCKVAIIIFQFIGRRYQNFVTVRQILHEQCPESIDKTSRACQRRLNYIMKNSHTQRSVNLCVEEMKQDKVVMRKLQDFIDMMVGDGRSRMSLEQRETQLAGKYKQLVLLLQVRYKELHHQNLSCLNEGFVLPDTVQELLKDYRILRPKSVQKKDFNDIHNVQDIYSGVIHSTIMSSLNCVGDKTSWAYQLFNIYQQYPDKLLRAMMTKTRADRMVSLRKHYMRKQMLSGDYLPLSSSPYQLSIRYINMLLTRYQFELYSACHDTYKGFASEDKYREVVASQGGEAACVIELLSTDQIDFKLNIPSQIIVMDPNVIKKDETYSRIVKRYQDILAKCKDTELVPTTAIFDQSFNISQDWSGEEVSKPTNNTVAKAASRIALYFTRDEYEKSENSCVVQNEMQHAHDFFVLNATKVFSKLIKNKINDKEEMQSLNPMPAATVSGLIKRIKRMAVFPNKVPSDMEVATKVSCRLGVHQELVLNLLDLIKAKKELGVTTDKIREKYGADPEVYRVLCALVDHQVCLCTGVIKTHFVHAEFHRPWIIRSHHLVRSEKDQITDADHQTFGMMIQFGKTDPNSDDVADPQLGTVAATLELTREASRSTSPVLSSLVYEPTPSTSSAPTPLLPITSFPDCPSEKQELKTVRYFNRKIKRIPVIEAKSKKDLNVCMRPWIRVNGSLNRRVLDKFLTSVLGHVMLVPLCSLQTVQERFSPAFQPHHTRELVEVEAKHFESAVSDESETDSDEIINSNNIECQKPNRDLPQIQTKPQSKTLTNRTSNVGSDLDHVEAKHFESAVSDESEKDSDEIINSNNIECQKPNRDLPQIQTKPQSKTLTNRMSNFGSDLDHVDLKNIEPVVLKETGSDETIRSDVLNNNQQTNSNRPQIPTRNQPKRFTNKMCNVGFDSDHIEERKITSDESDQSSLSSIEFDYHSDIYEPDETATSSDYSSSPEKETRKKKTKPSHTQNNKHNGRAEETTETKFERTEKNLTKPGKEIDSHLTCSSSNSSLSNNSSLVVTEYTSGEECVSNVKTTGGESVLGDAEGSAVDSNMDIISVGPTTVQKGRRKQQSCIFCKNLVTNFARHLTRRHKNEPQVLEFLHLSTKSKERKEKIKFLLNSGNFLHNKSVLREKNGTLIVSRRPTLDTENSQYLPCIHCKGFFINHLLYKHQNACTLNTEKRVKNTRSVQSKSRLLLDDNKLWPESFNRDILGTLQPGIVADIIKSDKIICQFGLRLFLSKTEAHKKPYIRNRMRELARLLQVVREKCGKINLEDLIDPTAYSNVIIGVQIVAGYDRVTCQFLHPSTATHLGHSLRQLADIVECNAILVNNKEARKKATDFLRVITTQWQYDVSSVAFKSIQDKKKNKPNIIPTAKDLQKIHKYLVEQEFLLNKELSENHSEDSYRNLCHIMLARVIVFNRRRSGETSRITVEDFSFCGRGTQQKEIVESLSSFEKHLTSVMSRFEICGKRNRNVAVLLTKDMKTSLQLLVNHRQSANVLPENPYLFAIPRTTSSYFRGNDVLRKVAKNSGAENPSVLTSTQLRKHIATISQVLDLQNTELKQLADFMGHNLNVHEKFYRLPENTLQLARISKILISMEKGKMHELKGKTLTEIDRAVESGFREAEVSEKPNDESSYSPDQPNQSSDNDDDNGDIMLGHTQFSSPIKHTKIRKPTRSYAKRKRTNYKPWSDEEKCALAKHMESLILLKKVPNKKQCEEVKKTEPILQRRTWVEIKSYIHNQFKRKDPFT